MKRNIIYLIILVSIIPTYSAEFYPQNNNYYSYLPYRNEKKYVNHIPTNKLNALERHAMNRVFKKENDIERIQRLENLAFGAIQPGNLNSRFSNLERAIFSRPKYMSKPSLMKNLSNYFAGEVTGFTPNIYSNSYNPSFNFPAGLGFRNIGGDYLPMPGYINQNFEQYTRGPFNKGWGISNNNFGNGSSVRILD